jgi:hypothetical protein
MSSIRKCHVCEKNLSRVCDCCKKYFCGKQRLKSHKRSCFPSTEDLSIEAVEHIEKLAKDLDEASLETFVRLWPSCCNGLLRNREQSKILGGK